MVKRILGWLMPFLPLGLAYGGLWLCQANPWYAEYIHARGVFPIVARIVSRFTSYTCVSYTELLAITSPLLLGGLIWLCVRSIRRAENRRAVGCRWLKGTLWALSSVFLLYMVLHGYNFYRAPMWALYGLDMEAKSPEFLQDVVVELATRASELREELHEDEEGVMRLQDGKLCCLLDADDALAQSRTLHPLLAGNGAQPKWVMLSPYWSYTGITGFYSMPLCEPNLNTDVPDFTLPFTVCHELAHTCGIAREDEANFCAFLLGKDSTDPEYQYAAYAMAYIYCSNALFDYDQDMWSEARAAVSPAMARDLADQSRYWKAHEGEVRKVSTQINDAFLKIQDQEDGVLSYDRVVALVLGWYAVEGIESVSL